MSETTLEDGTVIRVEDTAALDSDTAYDKVRSGRTYMLEMYVDWYQGRPLIYNDLTDAQKAELAAYRTALLDFPQDLKTHLGEELPLNYGKYYPIQPTFFDQHPKGRIHTDETQTAI